jgi:hypothetical protein
MTQEEYLRLMVEIQALEEGRTSEEIIHSAIVNYLFAYEGAKKHGPLALNEFVDLIAVCEEAFSMGCPA